MLRCCQEYPLDRPTFTEIREDLEVIISQGEMYVTFDIDKDSKYFLAPSFKSVPSEEEEDENIADEITSKPTVVRTAVHYQHS